MNPFDPQEVHSGTCEHCGRAVRDNEVDLYPFGRMMVCFDCADELEAQADEEARAEEEA